MTTTQAPTSFTLRTGFSVNSAVAYALKDAVKIESANLLTPSNLKVRINTYIGKRDGDNLLVVQIKTGDGPNAKYDYLATLVSRALIDARAIHAAARSKKFLLPVAWRRRSPKWKTFVGSTLAHREGGASMVRVKLYYDAVANAIYLGTRFGTGATARYRYTQLTKHATSVMLGNVAI